MSHKALPRKIKVECNECHTERIVDDSLEPEVPVGWVRNEATGLRLKVEGTGDKLWPNIGGDDVDWCSPNCMSDYLTKRIERLADEAEELLRVYRDAEDSARNPQDRFTDLDSSCGE